MTAFGRLLAIFLSTTLLNTACTKESASDAKNADSNLTLNLGNGAEPRELDPALATGEPEGNILDNINEGLAASDPKTLEPTPGLAESWTISPDGKVYTFKIRKDAKWSDGKEITAEDFVWSWIRVLTPMTASEYAYQLYYIKNGEDFNKGKIKDPNLLGVKAVDKHTLQVTLDHPTPYFLKLTAFRTLYPTPRHVIEKFPGQEWTKENNIVSSGPYKVVEWKLNRHIKVVPNEHYWDKESARFKEIYFYPIENTDTEEKMFLSGKLHMTHQISPVRIPKYEKEAKDQGENAVYRVAPHLATYFYWINVTRKPLDDKRVRRALALTVDRKEIVENITHGGQIPATSFTPEVNGYKFKSDLPESVSAANIAEAKKLLAEAGYPDGKGLPKIEILYNTLESHKKIAVAIQNMWKKNLGIQVELINQEWKVYLDTQRKFEFTLSRGGWVADYPDPNTFLDIFLTGGGNNHTKWSNKTYDDYIRLAGETLDTEKRNEYFTKAEAILMDELPVIPVYVYTRPRLVVPELKVLENGKPVKWEGNIVDKKRLQELCALGQEVDLVNPFAVRCKGCSSLSSKG